MDLEKKTAGNYIKGGTGKSLVNTSGIANANFLFMSSGNYEGMNIYFAGDKSQ